MRHVTSGHLRNPCRGGGTEEEGERETTEQRSLTSEKTPERKEEEDIEENKLKLGETGEDTEVKKLKLTMKVESGRKLT